MLTNEMRYRLIQFLVSITEGAENNSIKKYIYQKYLRAISIDMETGRFHCNKMLVNDNEYFTINQVIIIFENYLNSFPNVKLTNNIIYKNLAEGIKIFINNMSIDPDTLCDISFEKYEKNSLTSSFIALPLYYKKRKYWLNFDYYHQYKLSTDNKHGIRKLLEMLKEGQCLVFVVDKEAYCAKGIDYINNFNQAIFIEFSAPGEWSLWKYDANNEKIVKIIYYKNGKYRIARSLDIEGILKTHNINSLIKDENVFGSIVNTIDKLIGLNKGAIICFLEDKKVLAKLKKYKRVFTINNKLCDEKSIEVFASIDGAIVCDFSGNFLGYGAILDGEANTEANLQRGSRYNSTLNFIQKKRIHKAFGVVISDDGMIDIIVKKQ